MLVRPCGAPAMCLHHFENRIGLHEAVRKDRYAVAPIIDVPWQLRRVDRVERNMGRGVLVDAFIKDEVAARAARACGVSRVEKRAVVADVVEDAMRYGRAACD